MVQKAVGVAIAGTLGLGLVAAVLLVDRTPTAPPKWNVVGGVEGGTDVRFVRLGEGQERNRTVYDHAVEQLCGQPSSPRICYLYFYGSSEPAPQTMPRRQFFSREGSGRYPALAIYTRNRNSGLDEFGSWDCERAGVDGAPLAALCGPGIRETYDAIVKIATRTSTANACGWPRTDDAVYFEAFLAKVDNPARRNQYRESFDKLSSGRGPDNLQNCPRLRDRMETAARDARRHLDFPQPATSRQNAAQRGGSSPRR